MRGDVILVGDEHRAAARGIVDHLVEDVRASDRRFTITVAGESGSGNSEMGRALVGELGGRGIEAVVLQQDDYYVLPPRFNDAAVGHNGCLHRLEGLAPGEGQVYAVETGR